MGSRQGEENQKYIDRQQQVPFKTVTNDTIGLSRQFLRNARECGFGITPVAVYPAPECTGCCLRVEKDSN
jgi:hypothetical protein